MQITVSVIVPVYNTGHLLRPCLDSLQDQTLTDMEFILVNDGSTDESGAICDEYAANDSRFRVIHKKNAGVSRARNDGISVAQGQFIGFVDSDDTIHPDMFLRLFEKSAEHSADIVLCDSVAVKNEQVVDHETFRTLPTSTLLSKSQITPEILLEIAGSACRCIYRTELLRENTILFPVDLKFSEDRIFNICAIGSSNYIYYCKEVFYNRLLHSSSAVHRFYPNYFEIAKDAANRTKDAIAQFWNDDEAFQTAYLSQFIGAALAAINNYFYKTSTLSKANAFQKVRSLCEDAQLRSAISKSNFGGIRAKWILQKQVWLLCACAVYLNQKHRR